MNDDLKAKAAAQARELAQKLNEAMAQADELRGTLIDHAKRSADRTHEQTTKALDRVNETLTSENVKDFLTRARDAANDVAKHFTG